MNTSTSASDTKERCQCCGVAEDRRHPVANYKVHLRMGYTRRTSEIALFPMSFES